MISDYKIVEKADKIDLEYEVKELIEKNWQPFGSLVIYQTDGYTKVANSNEKTDITIVMYLQTMVLYS